MAETLKRLGHAVLTGPGTQDTLYTVPASTETNVKMILAMNLDNSEDVTLKIWHGGTTNADLILPVTPIDMDGGFADSGDGFNLLMAAGESLYAEAGKASSITVAVYGVEFS